MFPLFSLLTVTAFQPPSSLFFCFLGCALKERHCYIRAKQVETQISYLLIQPQQFGSHQPRLQRVNKPRHCDTHAPARPVGRGEGGASEFQFLKVSPCLINMDRQTLLPVRGFQCSGCRCLTSQRVHAGDFTREKSQAEKFVGEIIRYMCDSQFQLHLIMQTGNKKRET